MTPSTENKHSVLVVSRRLSADAGFRQTLVQAGISVFIGGTETEASRIALQKVPRVVVAELDGDPAANASLLKFADDYTRSHEVEVILLSENAVPAAAFHGTRAGSIRWIDSNLAADDCLAHIVADAAGSLAEFDKECEARFGSEKTGMRSLDSVLKSACNRHARWEMVPDDQKADNISDLIETVIELEAVANARGLTQMAQVAKAIHGLAEKVRVIPQRMNVSISRTIRQGFDLLPFLVSDINLGSGINGAEPSILVLDDIAMIRRLHCNALEAVNLPAISLDDPSRALELFEKQHFDLVFLDIHMPKLDGFHVCKALHESPTNSQTPAVFVTGLRDMETKSRSEESGGIDFIAKPVLQHELGLKALIHLHRSRRKIAA